MHTQAINTLKYRQKLQTKLERRRQLKLEEEKKKDNQVVCDHDWKRYKERIIVRKEFDKTEAYFIVSACIKCKTKKRLELVVV